MGSGGYEAPGTGGAQDDLGADQNYYQQGGGYDQSTGWGAQQYDVSPGASSGTKWTPPQTYGVSRPPGT